MILTIEGANATEMKNKILDFAQTFGLFQVETTGTAPEIESITDELPKPKKTRGKKPVETAPAPVTPVPTDTPAEEIPAAATLVTVTKEDAMASLSALVKNSNLDAGRDVLSRFGCTRFSEVPADKYLEFVQACSSVTAFGVA